MSALRRNPWFTLALIGASLCGTSGSLHADVNAGGSSRAALLSGAVASRQSALPAPGSNRADALASGLAGMFLFNLLYRSQLPKK